MQRFMNKKERDLCKRWIYKNITDSPRHICSSYVVKHMFQRFCGVYSMDEEFQEVMLECGHIQDDRYKSIFYARVNPEVLMKYYR